MVFAFFTISGAKLPHYILPAVPPLGMLVAAHFARREQGGARPLIPFGAWTTTVVMAIVANVGMWTWYHGLLPGSADQSEIHAMAREIGADLRSPGESVDAGRVAIYKMGRQNRDLGTGGLKVQETDLPSLMFYLGCKATKTDRFEDLLGRQKDPLYILTRDSRIGSEEERLTQRWGGHLSPTVNGAYYSEWVLTPPGWVGAK